MAKGIEMVQSGKINALSSTGEQGKESKLKVMGCRLEYWGRASEVRLPEH